MALPKIDPVHTDEARHLRVVDASLTSQVRIEQIAQQLLDNDCDIKGAKYGLGDVTERIYYTGNDAIANAYHGLLAQIIKPKADDKIRSMLDDLLRLQAEELAAEIYVIEVGL